MSAGTNGTTLEQLRKSVSDLPTIPETLSRILKPLEDPNSGARELAEVIRGDAPLASKILRLANSPLYQKTRTISTVHECVAVLGYRTVRQVALCVSVVASLGHECEKQRSRVDYRDIWRHGVTTGAVASELAIMAGYSEPEEVFTCGLLHDLGKFVLTVLHPETYAEVIVARCRKGGLLTVHERDAFGFDHAEAGAALADAWNFPAHLVSSIGGHHATSIESPEIGLVALADYLANLLDPASQDLGFDAMLVSDRKFYDAAGLGREKVEGSLGKLRAVIESAAPLRDLD